MYFLRYILMIFICIFSIGYSVNALELGSLPLRNIQEKQAINMVKIIQLKGSGYTNKKITNLENQKVKKIANESKLYYRVLFLLKQKNIDQKSNTSTNNQKNPRIHSYPTQNSQAQSGKSTNPNNTLVARTGSIVTVHYTLHVDSESGPIQETTRESVARANGLYKTGSLYQTFQVALGMSQVILGFDRGLMGVKKGDKKIIKVIPTEGYGTPVLLSKDQIAPEYNIVRNIKMFDKTFQQTIKKVNFPSEMRIQVDNAKVGDILTSADKSVAKIVKITSDALTIDMENTSSPFYQKELIVGNTATTPDADFKIIAIDTMNITLSVTNKKSPFYGKKFAVGESVAPNGNKITIKEINKDTVSILADHPFMNKTLYFDIEVVDVQ